MPARKKEKKAKLNSKEAIAEISKRTNIPIEVIDKIILAYNQIVTECLLEEVEVQFGEIGFFSWRKTKIKKNLSIKNLKPGTEWYNKPKFRTSQKWEKEFRETLLEEKEEGEENNVVG